MKFEHKHSFRQTTVATTLTGGMVTSFKVRGVDIFYPHIQLENEKFRGGDFWASPIFGPDTRFGGPQHGYLRTLEAPTAHHLSEGNYCGMGFAENGSGYYPWKLDHEINTILTNAGMIRQFAIYNAGYYNENEETPLVQPGYHPYFAGNVKEVRVTSNGMELTGFTKDATWHNVAPKYGIIIETQHYEITMTFGGDFLSLKEMPVVLWTDNPQKYFCVEPIFPECRLGNASMTLIVGIFVQFH